MLKRKVRGLYQPDKIAFLEWGENLYLVTADEGKAMTNPSLGITDAHRGRFLQDVDIDAELQAELQDDTQLGRTFLSVADRVHLNDPIRDLYVFGGRGFSIFNGNTLERQWESGDLIEKFSRWFYPDTFNGAYITPTDTPTHGKDFGSPLYGPALNTVATTVFRGRTVMFFGGGTNGLIYTFQAQASVTNKVFPEFQSVHRRGAIDGTWANLYSRADMGDIGITDFVVIDEAHSSVPGSPILVVLSEKSGSVSTYSLDNQMFPTNICQAQPLF